MRSLAKRRVLVTGGSRGIGRATVRLLGQLGARVVVHYAAHETEARQAVAEVEAAGGAAQALQADLAHVDQAERLVEQAEAVWGGLDVVVVNHGIWKPAAFSEMTTEQWSETLDLNLTGAWAVCRRASVGMVARGSGAIVLVASTAGQRGEARYAHYAATKGALIALTQSLAAELAPHGIRVNAVAPGWVLTDMSRRALSGKAGEAEREGIPLGRPGNPDEIAGPIAFLASDLASYLCGEILCVNGGSVMVG